MDSIKFLIFDWGDTLMADDSNNTKAMYLWEEIKVMPEVTETIPCLSKKYTCIVGSNAGESDAVSMKKAFERVKLDGYFDYYFTSKELGARKPDTAFFENIMRQLGATTENTVMIGNDYRKDILGAKIVGLKTVLITDQDQCFPEADFVIKSFGDLIYIL